MSTTTTSASSLIAIPCATVAPTLPPPTTVTFVFIENTSGAIFAPGSYSDAFRLLQDRQRDRRDDKKVGEGTAAGGLPRHARRRIAGARGGLLLRIDISAQRPAHHWRRWRGAVRCNR